MTDRVEARQLLPGRGEPIADGVVVIDGDRIADAGPATDASKELEHLVEIGMSPLEAIEAATATGPLTLGPQAPRTGLLAADHDADVLALSADPVADVRVLQDPTSIAGVGLDGERVVVSRDGVPELTPLPLPT